MPISDDLLFFSIQGPRGEIAGPLVVIPLPKDHLILRAASESDGKRNEAVKNASSH